MEFFTNMFKVKIFLIILLIIIKLERNYLNNFKRIKTSLHKHTKFN